MAYLKVENVNIKGISACVPNKKVDNYDTTIIRDSTELKKYIETTGVRYRFVAEEEICSSDLCFKAANKLMEDTNTERSDVDCLIFVTQTPDYIFPASACILQHRLGLNNNCISFDITMSCPGWIYGLSVIGAMMMAGKFKKALLLVGETSTKAKSPYDRVNLLAGDAGTATLLEYKEDSNPIYFNIHSDGANYRSLIIPEGGYRKPASLKSFEYKECEDGVLRNGLQADMQGDDILSFAINIAPKCIKELLSHFNIDDHIDLYLIHQANALINKLIQKRLKISDELCPNNIHDFGNTSSTTIPLMIVSKLRSQIFNKNVVGCAFGTGLAWGSMFTKMPDDIYIPELLYL